ncbi:hypothetical protein KY309_02555 [Candidatus Woesearchaeota archaeon]|nr:hypothetical protein [Candidatus Woesearchaeota archaeon]MBW3016467.1 hypothetical protein [Candidatus Woesearchaeota archaeon]
MKNILNHWHEMYFLMLSQFKAEDYPCSKELEYNGRELIIDFDKDAPKDEPWMHSAKIRLRGPSEEIILLFLITNRFTQMSYEFEIQGAPKALEAWQKKGMEPGKGYDGRQYVKAREDQLKELWQKQFKTGGLEAAALIERVPWRIEAVPMEYTMHFSVSHDYFPLKTELWDQTKTGCDHEITSLIVGNHNKISLQLRSLDYALEAWKGHVTGTTKLPKYMGLD